MVMTQDIGTNLARVDRVTGPTTPPALGAPEEWRVGYGDHEVTWHGTESAARAAFAKALDEIGVAPMDAIVIVTTRLERNHYTAARNYRGVVTLHRFSLSLERNN